MGSPLVRMGAEDWKPFGSFFLGLPLVAMGEEGEEEGGVVVVGAEVGGVVRAAVEDFRTGGGWWEFAGVAIDAEDFLCDMRRMTSGLGLSGTGGGTRFSGIEVLRVGIRGGPD